MASGLFLNNSMKRGKTMEITLIDMETWERKSHFEYYRTKLKCGYHVTVPVDVTHLREETKKKHLKFFPAFVYCVSRVIKEQKEFRMALDSEGRPGYFDCLHPNYTIFHEDDHTFSDLWTEHNDDFHVFYRNMTADMEAYRDKKGVKIKEGQPRNFYCISCVPWLPFTGYEAYVQENIPQFFPIIVYGAFKEEGGRTTVPFCLSIAHAAADGYHTSMFFKRLQEILDEIIL